MYHPADEWSDIDSATTTTYRAEVSAALGGRGKQEQKYNSLNFTTAELESRRNLSESEGDFYAFKNEDIPCQRQQTHPSTRRMQSAGVCNGVLVFIYENIKRFIINI